ncbi:cyclic-phosphate processing receiver domain-containing protein [Heyndrickxia acidicola]|uniref:Cyclic-phosphate processing Receiver domain-containing protein n=1 Tax=Heyndrickxia acidicola TaxID=209389 RepID=A0ABU6MJ19_9BACI|nr:cyclic-phosphate processing receiver domain-containing protein [Heyndrickxia acidicola]MED1204653.1 hypothetical protein [Heyndrickxia acidicola]
MKINVFLDDIRSCPQGHILVKDIDACAELLTNFSVHHLSLDYDLVDQQKNGMTLVRWIVEQKLFPDRITIHSANSIGGKAMYIFLKEAQEKLLMPRFIKVILRPLPISL